MKRILLLNSSNTPIAFVTPKRAVSLLLRNKVDVLSTWDDVLIPKFGSTRQPLIMPATLRLNCWVNRRYKTPHYRRSVVFVRDDYTCQYCNKKVLNNVATIDHVIPKSQGGQTNWKNCVTCCQTCNRLKGDKTPQQAGMKLSKIPTTPVSVHFWNIKRCDSTWHDDWSHYVHI